MKFGQIDISIEYKNSLNSKNLEKEATFFFQISKRTVEKSEKFHFEGERIFPEKDLRENTRTDNLGN